MAIRITEDEMTSDLTPHRAAHVGSGDWAVTWLPRRHLTQNQAVTAMTMAEVVATHGPLSPDDKIWIHFDRWAEELRLTGPHAVGEISISPEQHGEESK